ncbi:porin [Salinarimonas rosea]|uniref:porin n=1 Tax=Salinarimonas rosea TaxID=552063 RepID=UPI00040F8056|nr:porin [Salinarimonas rosea]
MKLAKSLLLGSAAGLVAVAGAQAADLPVRAAAPVDYVRTCPNAPIGGTGFFVIPGTETCLQISGYVRAEYRFAENLDTAVNRTQDDINFFARGSIAFDARTATEMGTLRSFIRINADRTDGAGNAVLDQGFIQFAGLTAGRITSFFSFFGGNLMTASEGLSDPSVEVLAYTATFGSGFSATVAVEDGRARRTNILNAAGVNIYGGQELPDLVANLNVAQAWGSAQVMGALHQVRHNVPNVAIDDELGWAIGAGINIRLPMIAAGDALWLQAVYADGAVSYADAPNLVSEFSVGLNDAYVNVLGTSLVTTEAWSLAAAFRHYWTPTIWQDIQGAYGEVDVPTTAAFQAAPGAIVVTGTVQDYTWWQLGTRLNWRPVSGLTFSADVAYTEIDTENRVWVYNNGVQSVTATNDDGSRWAGRLRIQRDF